MDSNSNITISHEDIPPAGESNDESENSQEVKCFHLDFDDQAALHLVNFYEPESADGSSFRWSEPVAMVRLDIPASDYEIIIETGNLRCGDLSFPFRIYWNDQPINKKNVRLEEGKIIFNIERSMFIRNDEQRLTFSCKPLRAEKGRRQLGLPVKWIRMQQTGATDPEFANPTKTRSRFWRRDRAMPKLRRLIGLKSPSPTLPIWEMKLPNALTSLRGQVDKQEDAGPGTDLVIVASVEINSRHGTGLLIQYMFEDFSQITTVSSQRCFHGDRVRSAKHFEVPFQELERHQIYELVLNWFKSCPPKRAYVVPYYKTELIVAIALADLFGTEICLHVMDDQCLYEDEISIALMEEALAKSGLTFVISPEMRDAYEERFGKRVYILPPVVPENMICKDSGSFQIPEQNPEPISSHPLKRLARFVRRKPLPKPEPKRGIIIGNIWDEKWLEKLQATIRNSGFEVDWYSNNPDAIMLSKQKDQLTSSGIHLKKPLWSDDLVNELRQRPFAIMPSGMLGPDEDRESLARLSLPSRLPFVMSVSQIPIVVLGSRETAAAQFVERFSLGRVIDYDHKQFKEAAEFVLRPEVQEDIRSRASSLAPAFSASGLSGWIDDSIRLKQPVDNRFESLFTAVGKNENWVPKKVQQRRVNWNKEEQWRMLGRLKKQGISPENIVDVGAGDGAWSWTTSQVFPNSNYVLVEPMLEHYNQSDCQQYHRSLGDSQILKMELVSDAEQESRQPTDEFASHGVRCSLDQMAQEQGLQGSVLLKIDSPENLLQVLAGGKQFIKTRVEVMIVTLELNTNLASGKSYSDCLEILTGLDFQLVDESVAKRCPRTDVLQSKNLVLVKREYSQKRLAA